MMTEELEKELEKIMEDAVKGTRYEGSEQKVQLRPVPGTTKQELTLVEQIDQLQNIATRIWDRINEAKLKLQEDYDRQSVDIENSYARRMLEERVKLERLRDGELFRLSEAYQQKIAEFDALTKRLA